MDSHPAASKSARVAADIRDAIRSGELRRGSRYSARQLSQRFGASRTPVREALLRLADLGMVGIERGAGARVLGPDGRGIVELCILRILLEPAACRSAAAVMSSRDDDELAAAYATMAERADGGTEYFAADERLHLHILRASGNRRLAECVAGLRQTLELDNRHSVPHHQSVEMALADHHGIVVALRDRDGTAAERAMRRHLVRSGDLLVTTTSADHRELIAEWRRWVAISGSAEHLIS